VSGRSAREAIENFVGSINETLTCVTDSRLSAYQESARIYKLLFRSPIPIASRSGDRFYISVTQACTVDEREGGIFRAHMREYSYVFADSPHPTHHGIVSYHWHPNDFALRDPHLHLKLTPNLGTPEIERKIARAHFPTSRVCLEDFIRLLIVDYDIRPALYHSTW
jgi:hypothetical protein